MSKSPRSFGDKIYWGSSTEGSKWFFYDECTNCQSDKHRHKGKGLCIKCYYKMYGGGDRRYTPTEGFDKMRPYIETRNKRVEKANVGREKKVSIIAKIKAGWPTWKLVEELGINIRTVYRWRRRIKEEKL